jgi:hypothetical protein
MVAADPGAEDFPDRPGARTVAARLPPVPIARHQGLATQLVVPPMGALKTRIARHPAEIHIEPLPETPARPLPEEACPVGLARMLQSPTASGIPSDHQAPCTLPALRARPLPVPAEPL